MPPRKSGERSLTRQAERWRRLAGLVTKLLLPQSRRQGDEGGGSENAHVRSAALVATCRTDDLGRLGAERDLTREIEAHRQLAHDEFLRRGFSEVEARAAADRRSDAPI